MSYKLDHTAYCIEYFYAKKGYRDKLADALLALVELSKAEDGCLQYDLLFDINHPDLIILIVKFSNQEMMASHEQMAYIQHFADNELKQYCETFIFNDARQVIR